jgi:hypothetical protein
MVDINVMEQVNNLAETSMVQRKWEEFGRPVLHGWIYGLRTGSLKGHACPRPGARLDPIYMFDFWDKPPQSRQPGFQLPFRLKRLRLTTAPPPRLFVSVTIQACARRPLLPGRLRHASAESQPVQRPAH